MGKKSRAKRQPRAAAPTPPPPPQAADQRTAGIICAALFAGVVIVYGQLAGHNFVNYDDEEYVTQNAHVMSGLTLENIRWAFTESHSSNWHPLTWMSHMLDVQLFEMKAGRHLMTNLLLHGLNSILLFLLLRRATSETWRSAAVAGLFALHPLHVESVAWVSERKDVLSTLFFMLTIWLYIAWTEKRTPLRYILTVFAFALGLMSKPMLVTLPFVLLLLDWWPLRRFSLDSLAKLKALVIEKLPMFALLIPAVLFTLSAQKYAMRPIPLGSRIANAVTSYGAYLGKMLWPTRMAVIYPFSTRISVAQTVVAGLVLIAITIFVLYYGRRFTYLCVGWFWYLGTLVPVIGIVQVGNQSMADRYTYIPLIGIFIAVVWLIGEFETTRKAAPVLATVGLFAYGATSFVQAKYWKDSFTLSRHALDVTQGNDVAHTLLGIVLFDRGARDDAEREFRAAIEINPSNAEAQRSLGRLKLAEGRTDEAIPLLEKSVALRRHTPTQAALAAARGRNDEAIRLYQQALADGVEPVNVRNDLGALLAKLGRDAEALAQYQEALRQMPGHYDARMNLGALLSRMGRDLQAIAQFAAAAKERPESPEPHVYLALVYANRSQFENAIAEVNQALAIDPITSNREFTNAVRMPFKESNLRDYLAFLRGKTAANRG
jgi:tetratricopeptide (TPR) repeat protein